MAVLLRGLRALLPVLRLQPWVLSGMIILGVLAALSEGLSISLFIPLIQDQMGTQTAGIAGRLTELFKGIPSEHRLLWIGFSIFLCMALKNALSYSYSLLFHSVNASIGHRIRCGILHQLLSVGQSYLDSHDSGKLINVLATETWRVSSACTVLASVIINVCMTLIFGILLLLISWKLTLIIGCFDLWTRPSDIGGADSILVARRSSSNRNARSGRAGGFVLFPCSAVQAPAPLETVRSR
jgi:ATP-binding cassette, subfamily B, bacterial MsbA